MVKKAVQPEFTVIGDELSATTAFIQVSSALDVAAFMAVQKQDIESLMGVASLYMQLGERLAHSLMDEGEEDEYTEGFGFSGGVGQIVEVDDDVIDEEDEAAEDA